MVRLALIGCASLALAVTAGGCAAYRADPLDGAAALHALRGRSIDDVVVERARLGAPGPPPSPPAFDPTDGLDEAEVVSVALSLNPELRAKRLAVGEARALLVTAGLWPNPEVGIGWRPGISGSSGYNVEADALFQLLRPGERAARQAVATAKVDEAIAEAVAEEYRVAAEVRAQWLAVLAAEQSAKLLDDEVALRERSADLVRQRRKLGEATELEVSVAELERAEVRRDQRKSQSQVESERRELNRLLGLPPSYDLRLADSGRPLTVTVFDDPTDDDLDRLLLSARPELRAREAAYRGAEEALRLAVLGQFPRLGFGPSFERELDGGKSLGLGLSLELPLLNQNQGEIAERRAARERLKAEYTALLHRLRADAHDARADLRRAAQEVEAQEREVVPLIRRNRELFEGAYRARELGVVDWVAAQQRAVRARREYLDTLVRYRGALIRLESAVGRPLAQRPAATTVPATSPAAATGPN